MRIPSSHHESAGRTDSTMTSMIDVVFLLLIFFICTASFAIPEQLLPSSVKMEEGAGAEPVEVPEELKDLQEVVVTVGWTGQSPIWTVNEQAVTSFKRLRGLLQDVAAVDIEVPVILDVADPVPLGHVLDVYDAARLAGFEKIQFATTAL